MVGEGRALCPGKDAVPRGAGHPYIAILGGAGMTVGASRTVENFRTCSICFATSPNPGVKTRENPRAEHVDSCFEGNLPARSNDYPQTKARKPRAVLNKNLLFSGPSKIAAECCKKPLNRVLPGLRINIKALCSERSRRDRPDGGQHHSPCKRNQILLP